MKPTTCKHTGCVHNLSCKYYKPTDKYPYYVCRLMEDVKDYKNKNEKGANDE